MKNRLNLTLTLLFLTSSIFFVSCTKETPLPQNDTNEVVASKKQSIEFKANSQFDEYNVYFHVMRGVKDMISHPHDVYFPMNTETVFKTNLELKSGDQIYCYAKTKTKGSYITCSLTIEGSVVKEYDKLCSYGGFIYEVP